MLVLLRHPLFLSLPIPLARLRFHRHLSLSAAHTHEANLAFYGIQTCNPSQISCTSVCREVAIGLQASSFSALFLKTLNGAVGQWVTDVVKGVQGGHPVLRLACCSGLLLVVEDLKQSDHLEVGRSGLENETVISSTCGSHGCVRLWSYFWDPDRRRGMGARISAGVPRRSSLALVLASQSLPLVSQARLRALLIPVLARVLTSTISATFKSGTFISSISPSTSLTPEQHVHISSPSPLAKTLRSMSSSPLAASIPSICRFTANALALLLDYPTSRTNEGMCTVSDTLKVLGDMSTKIETDWSKGALASATKDQIDEDTKELTKSIWTTLKLSSFPTSCYLTPFSPPSSSFLLTTQLSLPHS